MDKNNLPGRLVAFEGIDGTGKSTQIEMVAKELSSRGHDVVRTCEPTDGPYGRKIRRLYCNREAVSREDELNLFIEDRKEHVNRLIIPSLSSGKIVLTDRYFLSTAAYQGAAGLEAESILRLNEAFAPLPDLAIIIELAPSESIRRIREFRKEVLNDFEREENLQKVAAVFKALQRDYIKRVDGNQNINAVHDIIMVHVNDIIE